MLERVAALLDISCFLMVRRIMLDGNAAHRTSVSATKAVWIFAQRGNSGQLMTIKGFMRKNTQNSQIN